MATVFLGTDLRQGNRRVAIKVFRPELAAALGSERFLHEIRLTATLQHPHILPLFDSGDADGLLYYVMPLVDGESLRDRLTRERQLPIAEALSITIQIAQALHYAHTRGVIHRDVKPGNILMSGSQAILADFGIARAVTMAGGEKLTATGLSVGTPHYMSPEQAAGSEGIDGRTDIYALSAVLYEMLAGDPPFTGSSAHAVIARKSMEPASSLRTVRDTVSAGLDRVVLKGLARVPADRFPTAADFAAALERPDSAPVRVRRRLRQTAFLLAGLLVVGLFAGLPTLHRASRAKPALDPKRVLFAPFENRTGDDSLDTIGEITVDWLIRELQETDLIEVVDQRSLRANSPEAGIGKTEPLGERVGAGTIVSLAYYRLSDSVRFQTRLIETATGARLYTSDPITAPLNAPLVPLKDLGEELVGAIVALAAPGVEWEAGGRRPPSYAAYREFMAGMAFLPSLNFESAIEHWFRAARLDSTFVAPLLSAASFMLVSGQSARADSLVSSIQLKRDQLRPSERQRLDNLSARVRGNISAALAALRPHAEGATV
jgi:TolB-like protein